MGTNRMIRLTATGLLLCILTPLATAQNKPCSGSKGGISHCDGPRFVCNDGSYSQSKKTCHGSDQGPASPATKSGKSKPPASKPRKGQSPSSPPETDEASTPTEVYEEQPPAWGTIPEDYERKRQQEYADQARQIQEAMRRSNEQEAQRRQAAAKAREDEDSALNERMRQGVERYRKERDEDARQKREQEEYYKLHPRNPD